MSKRKKSQRSFQCGVKRKTICVPKCFHDVWDGPKVINIHNALREADVTAKEFDNVWKKKIRVVKTDEKVKVQLLQLLKQGGFRGKNGHRSIHMRQKKRCGLSTE